MRPRHKTAENRRPRIVRRLQAKPASMRPRHKTAENLNTHPRYGEREPASMRPRHKTAENASTGSRPSRRPPASMRPRHKTAENPVPGRLSGSGRAASMRPRHKTAENTNTWGARTGAGAGFNEAAAQNRGKPRWRPRSSGPRRSRFNEAAAQNRGKRTSPCGSVDRSGPASMRPRHKTAENHAGRRMDRYDRSASMRPRHKTAENPEWQRQSLWRISRLQ